MPINRAFKMVRVNLVNLDELTQLVPPGFF